MQHYSTYPRFLDGDEEFTGSGALAGTHSATTIRLHVQLAHTMLNYSSCKLRDQPALSRVHSYQLWLVRNSGAEVAPRTSASQLRRI
jgi:hypothetical protein